MNNTKYTEAQIRHMVAFADTKEEIEEIIALIGKDKYQEIKDDLDEDAKLIAQHLEQDEEITVDYFNHSND